MIFKRLSGELSCAKTNSGHRNCHRDILCGWLLMISEDCGCFNKVVLWTHQDIQTTLFVCQWENLDLSFTMFTMLGWVSGSNEYFYWQTFWWFLWENLDVMPSWCFQLSNQSSLKAHLWVEPFSCVLIKFHASAKQFCVVATLVVCANHHW